MLSLIQFSAWMKLNPLSSKLKGVFSKPSKVEGSLIKLKPVNGMARIVTSPKPWWAEPPKEELSIDFYKSKTTLLSDTLKSERAKFQDLIQKQTTQIASLKSQLSEATSINAKLYAKIETLQISNRELEKDLHEAVKLL